MKRLGLLAAAIALSCPAVALASAEPTQPPLSDGRDRRRSRHRFGAHNPAKSAVERRRLAYKRQRAANRQRRKLLGK